MLLRHLVNGFVGYNIMQSSLPKIKNDEGMAQQFKEGFNLSRNSMKLAGIFEFVGSIFLFASVLGKVGQKLAAIGAIMINIVMGTAIYHHFKAGHGFKGAKAASKFFGINVFSIVEVLLINNRK